jgi:signal peptidase I
METQVNESQYPARRRPWTAVFLSLLMPGLGQIYCGDIRRGLIVMMVMSSFSAIWMIAMLHGQTPVLSFSLMMWGGILLATVLAAIDAWRRACRTRYDYQLKDYNHWEIYLMLIWISGAGVIGGTALIKISVAEAFNIGSNGMWPSVVRGDRLIVDKTAYDNTEPQRGDIVLFSNPQIRKQINIERIIALEGDIVEGKSGQLLINGRPLERQWVKTITLPTQQEGDVFYETNNGVRYQIAIAKSSETLQANTADFGPVTVPPYHCFVMGDNRNNSYDSRYYGTISLGAIKGKFRYIYWPGRDWSRFGKVE